MNNKEFFNILIGKPPLEVELEIEMKCREVDQLPESYLKAYSFALVKENRLQDLLIMLKILKPILLKFFTTTAVKRLVVDLLRAICKQTSNTLDDRAVDMLEQQLFPKMN